MIKKTAWKFIFKVNLSDKISLYSAHNLQNTNISNWLIAIGFLNWLRGSLEINKVLDVSLLVLQISVVVSRFFKNQNIDLLKKEQIKHLFYCIKSLFLSKTVRHWFFWGLCWWGWVLDVQNASSRYSALWHNCSLSSCQRNAVSHGRGMFICRLSTHMHAYIYIINEEESYLT